MSISTEIQRLQNAKAEIKSAIEEKGVEVGDGTIDTYAEKIGEISTGDGGYDEGYEAGQKAEYDRFWDNYQDYGNRTNYQMGFAGLGWNDDNFKPKYDLNATAAYGSQMFWNCGIVDLDGILNKLNLRLNTEGCKNFSRMFLSAKTKIIPPIDMTLATNSDYAFDTPDLVTIKLLKVSEDTKFSTQTFGTASSLENITIEGVIGNNIDFSTCSKLTHDSLMSIINALKDFSGTTTTRTLTLHADSKALLTDTEKAIATQKGWTIA